MEATKLQDFSIIAKAFQKKMISASAESDVIGSLLSPVAMMQVNSDSVVSNLQNSINPPLPEGLVETLRNAAEEGVQVELPGTTSAAISRITSLGREWLEKCIPCNLRLNFRVDLFGTINDKLLDILVDVSNNYLKELSFVVNMLNTGLVYQDACLLLSALKSVCIPDLQRMISLFSAMLYRETSKELLGKIDIMQLLVMPIFQPIFINIVQLFAQYKSLVTDPLQCVSANLAFQLEKIKTGGLVSDPQINSIEAKTQEIQKLFGRSEIPSDDTNVAGLLRSLRSEAEDYDSGISQLQSALGNSTFLLRKMLMVGIVETETILSQLLRELQVFTGAQGTDNTDFMLRQYDKLLIVRLIIFLSAVIQALNGGFTCDIPNEQAGNVVLAKFFEDFLSPQVPISIVIDRDTNDVQLFLDPANRPIMGNRTISTVGNSNTDQILQNILRVASTKTSIKPKCLFEVSVEDADKLASYLQRYSEV